MKTTEKLMMRWLAQPLGSLNKRELELLLLGVLIEDGYLPSQAAPMARKARITLTKAHGYLTDLALRQPVMADQVALNKLVGLLKTAEVVQDGEAFIEASRLPPDMQKDVSTVVRLYRKNLG